MAKNKITGKELRLLIGIVLVLIGIIGFRDLISILLIVVGGYIIYDNVKKRR